MERELQDVHARACRSAVERAGEVAQRQFGAIARPQLLAVGCSRSRIQHWLATGRLHRRYPGVYAWGRAELNTEGELAAALLLASPGAALHSLTALWWRGLLHRRPNPLHIASPHRCRSRQGVRVAHRHPLPRHLHRGLPVVPLAEAMLAATEHLTVDSLRLVLARAEYAKSLDRRELEAAIHSARPGTARLRAAVGAHLPALARCDNRRERAFVLLCEAHNLPIPEPNTRIGRYRPDMLWRDQMLIVELDGWGAHHSPAQLAADRERQSYLEARGFKVIRFTHEEVRREPVRVAATVRAELARLSR